MAHFNLALPFWRASQMHPERPALVAEQSLSYGQAAAQASAVSRWLGPKAQRVAILGSRSAAACLGVLGTCWAGATYFPLSLRWPEQRILSLLTQIQADALVVDARGQALLTPSLRSAVPRLLHPLDLSPVPATQPVPVAGDAIAYVIFTSGTTGAPKGVMIEAAAVAQLIENAQNHFELTPQDRLGMNFELSFDGSVFDMFLAWRAAASLVLIPPAQAMAPHAFLRNHQLTMAVLTPSTLQFLSRLKSLRPGSLPDLRWSVFGAEALLRSDALLWQEIAPNSQVQCTYGPTENTVTSMIQPFSIPPVLTKERDTVALGRPMHGLAALIVDRDGKQLPPLQVGELALQGPQLAAGYFQDPELTSRRFPFLNGKRSYLTGDLAYQDTTGVYHHLGRTDHQVKVMGHRVELGEVESSLRQASQQSEVAAIAWPNLPGQTNQIVAFVAGSALSSSHIQERLRVVLPSYALPSQVHCLSRLPYTENGKLDRQALGAWLEAYG